MDRRTTGVLTAALLLLIAPAASAAKLAGVELADSVNIGDAEMVLNGLGLRKKAIFKVYVAGLYLPQKQSDPKTILEAETPRQLVMQFVRKVGKDSLTGAWSDCLKSNVPNVSTSIQQGFDQLQGFMADVGKGDQLIFSYTPDSGTSIQVAGSQRGIIAGREFADALFSCWLGPVPPSEDFKNGLLGR